MVGWEGLLLSVCLDFSFFLPSLLSFGAGRKGDAILCVNQLMESNLKTPDLTWFFFSFRGRFGAVVDQNDIDEAVAHVCQKLEEKRGSSNTGGGGGTSNSMITQT